MLGKKKKPQLGESLEMVEVCNLFYFDARSLTALQQLRAESSFLSLD